MEITGKIIWAGELRGGINPQTGNVWASQDFTIEAQFNTPTGIKIQRVMFNVFGNDKLAEYALSVGAECTVHYGVSAREYNGKWYNDVKAYKVERRTGVQTQTSQPQQYAPQPQQQYMPQQNPQQQYAPQPQQYAPQPQQQNFPPQTGNSGIPF